MVTDEKARAAKSEYMRRYRQDPEHAKQHREMSQRWRDGHKTEHRAYTKQWHIDHPDHVRARQDPEQRHRYNTRVAYGVDYDTHLAKQNGKCALCGTQQGSKRSTRLCLDHDHQTGQARGLLCVGCNFSLGYFERGWKSRLDPEAVRAYLADGR